MSAGLDFREFARVSRESGVSIGEFSAALGRLRAAGAVTAPYAGFRGATLYDDGSYKLDGGQAWREAQARSDGSVRGNPGPRARRCGYCGGPEPTTTRTCAGCGAPA